MRPQPLLQRHLSLADRLLACPHLHYATPQRAREVNQPGSLRFLRHERLTIEVPEKHDASDVSNCQSEATMEEAQGAKKAETRSRASFEAEIYCCHHHDGFGAAVRRERVLEVRDVDAALLPLMDEGIETSSGFAGWYDQLLCETEVLFDACVVDVRVEMRNV